MDTYHTAVGDETAKMETAIAVLGVLDGLLDDVVLGELANLDGLVDTDDVLPDDTSGADVEMADFGVAHQALGKTDGKRRGLELGETSSALGELIHDGGLGSGNSIAILGRVRGRDSPSVNDD